MDAFTKRMVLLETYDESYGITHYTDDGDALDYIKFSELEDPCKHSLLYETINKFSRKRIHTLFGCTLAEFLELPRDICDHMFSVADEIKEATGNLPPDTL